MLSLFGNIFSLEISTCTFGYIILQVNARHNTGICLCFTGNQDWKTPLYTSQETSYSCKDPISIFRVLVRSMQICLYATIDYWMQYLWMFWTEWMNWKSPHILLRIYIPSSLIPKLCSTNTPTSLMLHQS